VVVPVAVLLVPAGARSRRPADRADDAGA
jgi:hypothetical protein